MQGRTTPGWWAALALVAVLAVPVAGGPRAWSTGGPYGGPIRALAPSPSSPGVIYVSAGGAIFRSTDSAQTWTEAGRGYGGSALAVHPAEPGTVFVAGFSFTARTTDGGRSWTRVPVAYGALKALAVDPAVPTRLYAGGDVGVLRSTDAGDSWSPANAGLGNSVPLALVVAPSATGTLFAGVSMGGVFKSTDSGSTWAPARAGIETQSIQCLAVDPTNAATVYAGSDAGAFKSTDGGGSWAALALGQLASDIRALAIDPATPATVYSGTNAGAFRSTDSGASWTPRGSGLDEPTLTALALDPTTATTLYAGGRDLGLSRSLDGGGSWAPANSGMTAHDIGALATPSAAPGTVYAGTSVAGFFRSEDAGTSWVSASAGLRNPDLTYPSILSLAVDPAAPATVYASSWTGVYKTTDAGTSWWPTGPGPTSVITLAIPPSQPATVYAGAFAGVFKSTDAGGSWSPASAGLPAAFVYALAFDPGQASTVYAAAGALYKSTDAGTSWAHHGSPPGGATSLAVDPTTPTTLYAGNGVGFVRSTDGGATWTSADNGLPMYAEMVVQALAVVSPSTVFAVVGTESSRNGVYQSSDGAGGWLPASAGLPPGTGALAASGGQPFTLYAGGHRSVWQATPPPVLAKGDFDGDGLTDLLFRNVADGRRNAVWLMNGAERRSQLAIVPDAVEADWVVRGVDDFNEDGRNDLVFWNSRTGAVAFWLMNGVERVGAEVPLSGGAQLDPGWVLAATGDHYAPDGKPDLVWRNATSQRIVIWRMDGTRKRDALLPRPSQAVDSNWTIVATRDYDGDSFTDFLWYNATSGKLVTWYMDSLAVRTSGQFTTPPNAGDNNWKVAASADYSGASALGTPPVGSPDIVWRNETSGSQVIWHMDFASTRVHGEFTSPPANTPALGWTIVGPR